MEVINFLYLTLIIELLLFSELELAEITGEAGVDVDLGDAEGGELFDNDSSDSLQGKNIS